MIIWITYTPDFDPLAAVTIPLWQVYAARHGYKIHVDVSWHDQRWHHSFHKLREVAKVVPLDWEWLWVLDLDTIPTNMTIGVEDSLITAAEPIPPIVMGRDINGLNSGSFFLRRNSVVESWLEAIRALRHWTSSEQHAMWELHQIHAFSGAIWERQDINSIPYHEYAGFDFQKKDHHSQWEPGHLLCHLPGMTLDKRLEIFTKYIPQIQR